MTQRSSNCKSYYNTVSTLVSGTAFVPGIDACTVDLPMTFSCQTKDFETADKVTLGDFQEYAKAKMPSGCPVHKMEFDLKTNMIAIPQELSPERLAETGMASNCAADRDFGGITSIARATCTPQYDMTHDATGERVRNTNMHFSAKLMTCDASDESMPQLEEDLKKLATYVAKGSGYTIDHYKNLACTFSITPAV